MKFAFKKKNLKFGSLFRGVRAHLSFSNVCVENSFVTAKSKTDSEVGKHPICVSERQIRFFMNVKINNSLYFCFFL